MEIHHQLHHYIIIIIIVVDIAQMVLYPSHWPAAFNNELCSLSGSVLPPETCFNKCFISKDLWKDFITVIKLRQNTNDDDDDDKH